MPKKFFDDDADLEALTEKTVAVLGYGNQGRAQALNLRDSGASVIVGSNVRDDSEKAARADGFDALPFAECVRRADVLMILIPDEVMPEVYARDIRPHLRAGQTLSFASGYNVYYRTFEVPDDIDVVLLAPRMIGREVRTLFEEGRGAPALVAVERDATGSAWQTVLALAKGIGATRAMALESSFEEETVIDLVGEQAVCGSMIHMMRLACEVLMEAGASPEAALLEVYASGELIAIAKAIRDLGLWEQLRLHSRTSQYGHQARGGLFADEATRRKLEALVRDIKSGAFHREWAEVQAGGMKAFEEVWSENLGHPVLGAEDKLYRELGRRE